MGNLPILQIIACLLCVSAQRATSQLVAVKTNATLPRTTSRTASEYDGLDSIYIFGGYTGSEVYSSDILKYSISTDSVQVVGNLPRVLAGGCVSSDSAGNIYYMGGYANGVGYSSNIYKFFPNNNSVQTLASLPKQNSYSAAVKRESGSDSIYILGGYLDGGILLFNTTSRVTEELGRLRDYWPIAAVSDNQGSSFIFAAPEDEYYTYYAITMNLTTLQFTYGPEIISNLQSEPTAVWDGKLAYLVGGYYDYDAQISNVIIQFDPETMRSTVLTVNNFPGQGKTHYFQTSAVYVESLNRIYFFGGRTQSSDPYQDLILNGIWYIELPERTTAPTSSVPTEGTDPTEVTEVTTIQTTEETTTEAETVPPSTPTEGPTTNNPDIFTCLNKTDGMYPHATDCDKFVNCNSEVLTEYTCPEPLLFDAVILSCNLPHLTDCRITCVGKEDGIYPHPTECTLFIGCIGERLWIYECPPPLLFNPQMGRCDLPELVTCESLQGVDQSIL